MLIKLKNKINSSYGPAFQYLNTTTYDYEANNALFLAPDDKESFDMDCQIISVNLPGYGTPKNCVVMDINNVDNINDIITQLQNEGILGKHVQTLSSGFVDYPVFELLKY